MTNSFIENYYNNSGANVARKVIQERNNVWTNNIPEPYCFATIAGLKNKDKTFATVSDRLLQWSKNNKRAIYVGGDTNSGKTYVGYAYLRRLFLKQMFSLDEACFISMSTVVSSCAGGFTGYNSLLEDYTNSGKKVFFIQGFYSHNSATNTFFAELFDKAVLNKWIVVVTGVPYNNIDKDSLIGKSIHGLFHECNISIFAGEYMRKLQAKN